MSKGRAKTGGFRPTSQVHFLCVDKENGTKRKRPRCLRLPAAGPFRFANSRRARKTRLRLKHSSLDSPPVRYAPALAKGGEPPFMLPPTRVTQPERSCDLQEFEGKCLSHWRVFSFAANCSAVQGTRQGKEPGGGATPRPFCFFQTNQNPSQNRRVPARRSGFEHSSLVSQPVRYAPAVAKRTGATALEDFFNAESLRSLRTQ